MVDYSEQGFVIMSTKKMREIIDLCEGRMFEDQGYLLDGQKVRLEQILELIRQGFEKSTGLEFIVLDSQAEFEFYNGYFLVENVAESAEINVEVSWRNDGTETKPVIQGFLDAATLFHYRVEPRADVFSNLLDSEAAQTILRAAGQY